MRNRYYAFIMKRISLIILAVAAIIAGSVSCQKVNDLDKRLTELEQTVSDLKSQILAGAVITSVDKTADGCTFVLSNGESYTVTNGKNGSDGEAIIADVKIEENFIVLTLKDGETLRISYQNPLSMVTLDIVPDFDDGTVKEPKTSEAMGMKSTNFYLDISVTPAKYAEILSDTERFIHKAVFSPVQTRSGFGNAFTLSPKRVTYCEGAPIPFLQASFELDDESAAVLQNTPYTVSYSIEDKDGVHGAATAFVTISHEKGSGQDNPSENIIPPYATRYRDWKNLDAEAVRAARMFDIENIRIVAVGDGSKFDLVTEDIEGNELKFLVLDGTFRFGYRSENGSYHYANRYEIECLTLDHYDATDILAASSMVSPVSQDATILRSRANKYEIKNIKATVSAITLMATADDAIME